MTSLEDEVVMNLVRKNENVMFDAKLAETFELFARPHAPDRVVRGAEDEELDFIFNDFALEVVEVDLIASVVPQDEVVAHDDATIRANRIREGIVDRLLNQNRIPRLGEGANALRHGKDDAGGNEPPFPRRFESMSLLHPRADRFVIARRRRRISENAAFDHFARRVLHVRGRLEIHVGNPERQKILRFAE